SGTFGFWYRDGYVRVLGGVVQNCSSAAFCFQYNCSFNLGSASSVPIYVSDSWKGVYIGRTSSGHVANCIFEGIQYNCVDAVMNCRVRTISNTFVSWGSAAANTPAVHVDDCSVWDNGGGTEADTFTGVASGFPAFGADRGSVTAPIYSSGRTPHRLVNTFYSLPAGSGRTLIADAVGYTAPIRFRGVSFFSTTMVAEVEFGFTCNANQGGLFELAVGPATGDVMTSITVPADAAQRTGLMKMVVFGPQAGSSICRAYSQATLSDGTVLFGAGTFL